MIILHNRHDAESRVFVEAHPEALVIDWYDDEARAAWHEAGGTNLVSHFPFVIDE